MKFSLLVVLLFPMSALARPKWVTEQTLRKDGQALYVVSEGTGPSLNIARTEALNNARKTAADFINSEFKIKTVVVRTEESTGLHEEISSTKLVKNMNCTPQDDFYEETDSSYRIWLKAKCDLRAIVNTKPNRSKIGPPSLAENISVIVSTIPKCSTIIITGDMARSISCESNPQNILLYKSDKQMILRAPEYQAKTIELSESNTSTQKAIEVIFEKN